MNPRRAKRWLTATAVVAALALGAASCGSDDASDAESTTSAQTSDTAAPSTSTVAANTATFRGVTEDTIKVGVAVPDFDALREAGIANYQGDADVTFQTFFDRINAAGGIYGRMIEPVYATFSFVDNTSQERVCLELTEDHDVFIVFYGLLGETNLCLTDNHNTMVMTDRFQTADLVEASGDTVWLQLGPADDVAGEVLGQVLIDTGRLDDKTVGILTSGGVNDGDAGTTMQRVLEDNGIDAKVAITTGDGSDPIAREAEIKVFAESFSADGVDFVIDMTGGGDVIGILAEVGYTPEYASGSLAAAIPSAADPSLLDGAVTVERRTLDEAWADPDFGATCIEPVLDDNPELAPAFEPLPSTLDEAGGEKNWANPVRIACNQTMLFQRIAELAGPELTNDSFRAALDDLGPVELPGYGLATFTSAGKWDGLDEFTVQQYDAETDTIKIVGDPIIIDR